MNVLQAEVGGSDGVLCRMDYSAWCKKAHNDASHESTNCEVCTGRTTVTNLDLKIQNVKLQACLYRFVLTGSTI